MKKTIPVLAFLTVGAAAGLAAYRKIKRKREIEREELSQMSSPIEDAEVVYDLTEVDAATKQSYRIQARLMAEGYSEGDELDLLHKSGFKTPQEMFSFVKGAKAKNYRLDEADSGNFVTLRLHIPANADAIYNSILEIAEMTYENKGTYQGFSRADIEVE